MTIKLDISPCSVVVVCDECPHWQAFAGSTRADGRKVAANHERITHPDSFQWRDAVTRHAGDSLELRTDPDSFSSWESSTDSDSASAPATC